MGLSFWEFVHHRFRHVFFFFFPEIEEVGFSLDSIPGLRSLLRHFAVSPPRSRPRPRGSLDLVEEKRSVVSDP